MKYSICVPIQVKSVEIKEITSLIKEVTNLNPNFIELRLDYINDPESITKDFLQYLINLIQPKIPVICTFRDSTEGGQITIEREESLKILKLMIEAKPKFIDIETNTEKEILGEVVYLATQNKIDLIFSYHNFSETPTYTEANNLIETFLNKLNGEMGLTPQTIENSIFKLIFTAQTFEDNLVPLRLCKKRASKKFRLISFCMGDAGLFSRIFCNFSGSVLTYCSYKDKTAPGQININKLRNTLKLLNFRT